MGGSYRSSRAVRCTHRFCPVGSTQALVASWRAVGIIGGGRHPATSGSTRVVMKQLTAAKWDERLVECGHGERGLLGANVHRGAKTGRVGRVQKPTVVSWPVPSKGTGHFRLLQHTYH